MERETICGEGGHRAFFIDAEEAGAAAGEGGVDGVAVVEQRLYVPELGMQAEDGFLKVVGQLVAPGPYGVLNNVLYSGSFVAGCA